MPDTRSKTWIVLHLFLIQLKFQLIDFTIMNSMKWDRKRSFHFVLNDTKKFRGNWSLILRNKKPEIFTTSGFDISLYYYSKSIPNHEALPP